MGELVVRSGLEPDEDELGGADILWAPGASGPDPKIAVGALDAHAPAPDGVVVGSQEEMDLMPGASQFGAVKAPDGAAADDSDLHGATKKAP